MNMQFNCPRCREALSVDERVAELTINCPLCKERIAVPPIPRQVPPVYRMKGASDLLEVFPDKLEIKPVGFRSSLAKDSGTQTIPFRSIIGIHFKRAGSFGRGYLKFAISNVKTFNISNAADNDRVVEIKNYIEARVQEMRVAQQSASSLADELQKLATLKSSGLLSESEFDAAKKRLLGGSS